VHYITAAIGFLALLKEFCKYFMTEFELFLGENLLNRTYRLPFVKKGLVSGSTTFEKTVEQVNRCGSDTIA
jgi:hypothetical protein